MAARSLIRIAHGVCAWLLRREADEDEVAFGPSPLEPVPA